MHPMSYIMRYVTSIYTTNGVLPQYRKRHFLFSDEVIEESKHVQTSQTKEVELIPFWLLHRGPEALLNSLVCPIIYQYIFPSFSKVGLGIKGLRSSFSFSELLLSPRGGGTKLLVFFLRFIAKILEVWKKH